MRIIHTAAWAINGTRVVGPDQLVYGETSTVGLRLDGIPQRQGGRSMIWKYQVLPLEAYQQLHGLWGASYPAVMVQALSPQDGWTTATWHMLEPTIGRRETFYLYDITIRFVPLHYTGVGISTGQEPTPSIYAGWQDENKPPVARITYQAALIGDPEIVVDLDGSSSGDVDGVILSYTWADNADAFQATPGYPYFDPPHTAETATAQFRYQYMVGMPNPVITLTVADNAALQGSATITVDVVALLATQITKGVRILVAVDGQAYSSINGGLTFTEIPCAGTVTQVVGAGGYVVLGCSDGSLYTGPNGMPEELRQVATMGGPVVCLAVSPRSNSSVIAVDETGMVAASSNSGQSFTQLSSPEGAYGGARYNTESSQEVALYGPTVMQSRNTVLWEADTAGLPADTWTAHQRTARLRYLGGSTGLYAATGTVWLPVDPAPVVALSSPAGVDHNDVIVGGISGHLRRLIETTLMASAAVSGDIAGLSRDESMSSVVLIATSEGLYKTIDNLATIGLMGFAQQDVTCVDQLRDGGLGGAEVIVCCGGPIGVAGVWHHTNERGWILKSDGLPQGWDWQIVTADPYDRNHWAVCGGTAGYDGAARYVSGQVYDSQVDLSPVWATTDAGISWHMVPLSMSSHIGRHLDRVGATSEWHEVGITGLAFDRTARRKLFVFGVGVPEGLHSPARSHAILWSGAEPTLAEVLVSASGLSIPIYDSYSDHTDLGIFVGGEGGPDGGIVSVSYTVGGFFDTETVVHPVYTTPTHQIRRIVGAPPLVMGQASADDGMCTRIERQPLFNAYGVVFGVTTRSGIQIYLCDDYRTGPCPLAFTLPGQLGTPFDLTYAIEGFYITHAAGLGLYSTMDANAIPEIYRDDRVFTHVRCDRQWRRSVVALAPAQREIHVRQWDGLDLGWSTLSYPHPDLLDINDVEIVGR